MNLRNICAVNLLDLGVVGAADVRSVEDAVAGLLGTTSDVLLVQAEAIVALEACAKGLARPGIRALNVATGPYGELFGRWLSSSGGDVVELQVPYDHTVSADEVRKALSRRHFDLVAMVHAEAATGGANPVDEISRIVHEHGALLVVDAVASVGGHPVTPDSWNADVVVIGGQKALAGPAGVSALSISDQAWMTIEHNPMAPRDSILSLLDLRDGWLRAGRTAVLGTPSSLETMALDLALARVAAEGLDQVIARHRSAAFATRAGISELGLRLWIADDAAAATVLTTVAIPTGIGGDQLITAARAAGSRILGPAPGSLARTTFRVNHTGQAADLDLVRAELEALASALRVDPSSSIAAAEGSWIAATGVR